MNKIGTDYGIFRIEHQTSVCMALIKAVNHMARYYFEPIRPDLLPDLNETEAKDAPRVYYGRPDAAFKREELSGVNATVRLNFETVARIKEMELEEGEALYIYRPYIEITWTTSSYTPEQAVLAGHIISEAGVASIGLPGAMAGTWSRKPAVFPAGRLTDEELAKLLELIGVER